MNAAVEIDKIFENVVQQELKNRGKKPLTKEQLDAFGSELDELRASVEADLGQDDVAYMRRMIRLSRMSEIVGRVLIHVSLDPITWIIGVSMSVICKNFRKYGDWS